MNRFTKGPLEVGGPDGDDKFTPLERATRAFHETIGRNAGTYPPPRDLPAAERRAFLEAFWAQNDLQDPELVRTDAVASVRQRSDDGEWEVRWVLAEQNGGLVVRAVTIEPTVRRTPTSGVSANLLRELRPAVAAAKAGDFVADDPHGPPGYQEDWSKMVVRFARREIDHASLPEEGKRKQGRPRLADDHIARVAEAYLRELMGPPGVLKRMGVTFGRDAQTMRDQVRIARRRGFLSPAVKAGSKGATPGPELLRYRATSRSK